MVLLRDTLPGGEGWEAPMSKEEVAPYGEELLKPLDAAIDVGTIACIQTLSSTNDDASGGNDDWTFTEMDGGSDSSLSITSLN